jgi:hypothetical protein
MAQFQINDTNSDASVVVDLDFNVNPLGNDPWSTSSGDEMSWRSETKSGFELALRTPTRIGTFLTHVYEIRSRKDKRGIPSDFRCADIRLAVVRRARCNFAASVSLCRLELAQTLRAERRGDVNALAAISVPTRSRSLRLRSTNRSIPLCTQLLLTFCAR